MIMQVPGDERADFEALGYKLQQVLDDLADPKARASGSDAATLARTRRVMGSTVEELDSDYALLGEALALSSGSGAAAVAQERRMLRKELATLRAPAERTKVAELESFRAARTKAAGTSARRRKSG